MHTPGPWVITLRSGKTINGAGIETTRGRRIATLPHAADRPYEQKEADARLIAAAPELLAALQLYVEACHAQGVHLGPITGDAEAAIAKAEGR